MIHFLHQRYARSLYIDNRCFTALLHCGVRIIYYNGKTQKLTARILHEEEFDKSGAVKKGNKKAKYNTMLHLRMYLSMKRHVKKRRCFQKLSVFH